MITNERQYRVTRSQLQKLEKSLPGNEASEGKLDPRLRAAVRDGLQSQIDELQEQIAEYERLKNSSVSDIKLGSLEELPAVLVKARVAQGMTQKDLARRLRMKEQQIQRYEADRYRSASLQRILQVAAALGVDLHAPTRLRRVSRSKQS
jgi:ribosome-binding protein aMBF1 (putative translation factor)